MPQAVRTLLPGEVLIGFMALDGKLIGELVEPRVGHEELSYRVEGLRAKLSGGQAVAITVGKTWSGSIVVFGSGAFPPLGGEPLAQELRNRARQLVE